MARRPGVLMQALTPPSSYAAKKTDIWDQIIDRIDACLYLSMVDDVETWLFSVELQIPAAWNESIAEMLEKKRDELQDTDIGKIIRDRYDF